MNNAVSQADKNFINKILKSDLLTFLQHNCTNVY